MFQGLSRLIGWVTLIAWLAGATVPSLTMHGVGGNECDDSPITSSHHHDISQFEGVQRAAGEGHCALCHFYRDLRTAQPADASFLHQIDPIAVRTQARSSLAPAFAARYSPSRAPPTSPA